MVEAALLMIPFFAILFAIIDYAQVYFYENALQNALREAARFATAGRVIPTQTAPFYETNAGAVMLKAMPDPTDPGREASRNECIRYWFLSNCIVQVPISNINIWSAPSVGIELPYVTTNADGTLHLFGGYTNDNVMIPASPGPGGAGDYVQITATYTLQTITPLLQWMNGGWARSAPSGGYPIRVSAIVKNEPAILNFEHTNMYPDEPTDTNGP